mmetsp:Transcript_11230/g.25224  ORF Transcript_11230/g.25224 Transcript_11230/m.25224 type:complete len:215 (+) Transcript_11230:775-1419(+)
MNIRRRSLFRHDRGIALSSGLFRLVVELAPLEQPCEGLLILVALLLPLLLQLHEKFGHGGVVGIAQRRLGKVLDREIMVVTGRLARPDPSLGSPIQGLHVVRIHLQGSIAGAYGLLVLLELQLRLGYVEDEREPQALLISCIISRGPGVINEHEHVVIDTPVVLPPGRVSAVDIVHQATGLFVLVHGIAPAALLVQLVALIFEPLRDHHLLFEG